MRVGFTGTQTGMTFAQGQALAHLILKFETKEFRHGDCVGADDQAHKLVSNICDAKIVIYPPNIMKKRAFCHSNFMEEPAPYLDRNKRIVDNSDIVIATPKENYEIQRSGTWSTVRYARKNNKNVYVIEPDGAVNFWEVWRLDDNGHEFKVKEFGNKEKAESCAKDFDAKGHKQSYFVRKNLWRLSPTDGSVTN